MRRRFLDGKLPADLPVRFGSARAAAANAAGDAAGAVVRAPVRAMAAVWLCCAFACGGCVCCVCARARRAGVQHVLVCLRAELIMLFRV
jgi:hypothetical protein